MEYRVWLIVGGAVEDDEVFSSRVQRDQRAEVTAREIRESAPEYDWQVWTADVSEGACVGEWAGEEAVLFASSEGEE